MKNILFIPLLFLLVGCGFFNKKDFNSQKILHEDEYVNFNDENGSFDLVDYFFPRKNQINEYRVRTETLDITNNILHEHTEEKQNEFTYIEDNEIALGDNISYLIEKNKITKTEFIDNLYGSREYRRHLDLNDVYNSYQQLERKDDYQEYGKLVCRLIDYNSTKTVLTKTYRDVIHIKCEGDFVEATFDESFVKTTEFLIEEFYAKDTGLIEHRSNRNKYEKHGKKEYNYETNILQQIQNSLN